MWLPTEKRVQASLHHMLVTLRNLYGRTESLRALSDRWAAIDNSKLPDSGLREHLEEVLGRMVRSEAQIEKCIIAISLGASDWREAIPFIGDWKPTVRMFEKHVSELESGARGFRKRYREYLKEA